MIQSVSQQNFQQLLPLMRQYQEFYKVAEISEQKNREFFARFGETSSEGCQFLYYQDDQPAGFATVYFTYASTAVAKVAILNDLFTLPEYRKLGIGRKLIEHCREFAKQRGAERLQWVTAPDNTSAQKLYDSLDTKQSQWLFYTYKN